jgi:hypothetical protein
MIIIKFYKTLKTLYAMTQTTLLEIITQLETLEMDELQKLSQAIQFRLDTLDESTKLVQLYNSLINSGLIVHIRHSKQLRLPLVSVKDKSISQTIIEERR